MDKFANLNRISISKITMKKYIFGLFAIASLLFSSCLKSTEPVVVPDPRIQLAKDTLIIRKFISENNILALKDSIYSIFYQIKTAGIGSHKYTSNSQITVKYVGKFLDGRKFDDKLKDSVIYTLGNLIPGWQIGVSRIQKGGKIRLIIPSGYAYDRFGSKSGTIPPNTILDFDIELLDVK